MCSYQAYHHFYLFFPHIDHTNSLILVLLLDLHSLIVFLQVYKSLCKSLIRNRLISSPDNAAAASCHSFENSFPKFKWLLAKTYCWKQTLFHWSFTSNCSIFFFKWANSLKLQHQLSMYTLYPLLQRSDKFCHYNFTNIQFFHQCNIFWGTFSLQKQKNFKNNCLACTN